MLPYNGIHVRTVLTGELAGLLVHADAGHCPVTSPGLRSAIDEVEYVTLQVPSAVSTPRPLGKYHRRPVHFTTCLPLPADFADIFDRLRHVGGCLQRAALLLESDDIAYCLRT